MKYIIIQGYLSNCLDSLPSFWWEAFVQVVIGQNDGYEIELVREVEGKVCI
jgi:hypothetical protein